MFGPDLSQRVGANLQVVGQVVSFLTRHLGFPIPSPAMLEKIGTRFREDVAEFAADNDSAGGPVRKGDRKLDVMRPQLAKAAATGRSGVVAIGVAQEFQRVFTGTKLPTPTVAVPRFAFTRPTVG